MTHDQRAPDKAIDFKSASLDTVRIVLQSPDMEAILTQLNRHLEQSAGFFAGEPVVIDATAVSAALDWAQLKQALQDHELHLVGVVPNPAQTQALAQARLPAVSLSRAPAAPRQEPPAAPPQPEPPAAADQEARTDVTTATPAHRPTKIIERQLRSGQRVYAQDSDLVVIGVVGQGAEIIADGNIHVYGPLRGRAMAGASGNTRARIFTTELDPELIAIAGVYKVIEHTLPDNQHKQPALIYLAGENLNIELIR